MNKNCFDNRELSWLKFNVRVLEEAQDSTVPLFERLSFCSIFQSNLDEFFMIRVGSLYDQKLLSRDFKENKTNMTCEEQLSAIFDKVRALMPVRDEAYQQIISQLEAFGIEQVNFRVLSKAEEQYTQVYFNTEIKPLISPQLIDKRHPFPFFKNKEIYAVANLESKSAVKLGVIQASGNFDRLIILPGEKLRFMLVEDLILHYLPSVFESYKVLDKSLMRVTRNADINAEEALYDHDVDFRDAMAELIKRRKKLSPVRLELSRHLSEPAVEFLCEKLDITKSQIFSTKAPLDLSFVYPLGDKVTDKPELFNKKLSPQKSPHINEFEPMIPQIQHKDILLSYPYESIKPFIRLLNEAAVDPSVVSVKITLYRVAKNSSIVEALINMAENGKDVLVLVELRARFDEENNIGWSKRLEDAGCTVIYGLESLKVHSKLLLITRKNGSKVEYITQIGTGNYNEKTSTLYTDLSLMTASTDIGVEAGTVFNALSIGNCVEYTQHLLVAPLCLQNRILEMMDYEIETAKTGAPAYIGLKLNSLTDKILIDKLIQASQAGVKIELLIRGICCLIAGIEGYTENIAVTSIVGRFLEHSRIYIFGTQERSKIYISSADFMTRNTLRRVEVSAPIYNPEIKARIYGMFRTQLSDNIKARRQNPDGTYTKIQSSAPPLNSQEFFYQQAYEKAAALPTEPPKKHTPLFNRIRGLLHK